MNFPATDTILYFLRETDPAIPVIKDLARQRSLKLYKADAISDVLAVPYLAAIVDGNLLEDRLFQFMRDPEYCELFNGEKLVLSGKANTVPEDVRKQFIIPKEITSGCLNELLFSE